MADREKVIKGLECCSEMSGDECQKCPYSSECLGVNCPVGMPHLANDALELLKEQESRVLTLSEINKNSFVWYENKKCLRLFPALVVDCQCITRHKFIVEDVFFDVGTYMPEDVHYGKSWRCWNYKPTDEQRKAVKWDD